jgi:cell division protein FtsQ
MSGRWLLLAGLGISLSVGLAWSGTHVVVTPTLPINTLRVEGQLTHVQEQTLRRLALEYVSGGFFDTDVEAVRRAIEAMPWVRSAAVRRVWPDALQVRISEHEPLAMWNGTRTVLSRAGETFVPAAEGIPADLPHFNGPPGSERYLSERYGEFRRVLATIGLGVARVSMDDRHALELELDNGIVLLLGRDKPMERIGKLVDIYSAVLHQRADDIVGVDLRYTNGFAVKWKQHPEAVGDVELGNRV